MSTSRNGLKNSYELTGDNSLRLAISLDTEVQNENAK